MRMKIVKARLKSLGSGWMIPDYDIPTPKQNELYGQAINAFGATHQITKFSSELGELASRVSQLSCDMQRGINLDATLSETAKEYVDCMLVTHAQFIEVLRREGKLQEFLVAVNGYLPVAQEKLRGEITTADE